MEQYLCLNLESKYQVYRCLLLWHLRNTALRKKRNHVRIDGLWTLLESCRPHRSCRYQDRMFCTIFICCHMWILNVIQNPHACFPHRFCSLEICSAAQQYSDSISYNECSVRYKDTPYHTNYTRAGYYLVGFELLVAA